MDAYQAALHEGLQNLDNIDIVSQSGECLEDSSALRIFASGCLVNRSSIVDGSQEIRLSLSVIPVLTALSSFLISKTPVHDGSERWEVAEGRLSQGKGTAERLAFYRNCPCDPSLIETDADAVACVAAMALLSKRIVVFGVPFYSAGATTTATGGGSEGVNPEDDAVFLDVRLFSAVRDLSLVDCRINSIIGTCDATHLTCLRTTIFQARASMTTWSQLTSVLDLTCADAHASGYVSAVGVSSLARTLHSLRLKSSLSEETFQFVSQDTPGDQYWRRLTSVDLSNNTLRTIHSSISSAKFLTQLILNNNSIQNLSSALLHCEMLVEVDVSGNELFDPHEITSFLPVVRTLNIARNNYVSIWALADLRRLEHLDVSCNKLGHWTDLRHLGERCLTLRSVTFRGNPLCEPSRVYAGDVNKLGAALFLGAVDVNGSVRTLAEKQSNSILTKYAALLNDEEETSEDALAQARTDMQEQRSSKPLHLSRSSSQRDNTGSVALSETPRESPRQQPDSSRDLTGTSPPSSRRIRVVKKVVRVKRGASLLEQQPDEGPPPSKVTPLAAFDSTLEDPATGDRMDLQFLTERYGPTAGLSRYNEMRSAHASSLLSPSYPETESFPKPYAVKTDEEKYRDPAVVAENDDTDRASDTYVRPAVANHTPPLFLKPLEGGAFDKVVDAALHKFLKEDIRRALPMADFACFSVVEEETEASPLHAFSHKNIWQSEVSPDQPVAEIWVCDTSHGCSQANIEAAPERYNARHLIKVEMFQCDCTVGFSIRHRRVVDVTQVQNFPQPILTSLHFCPWSHGRTNFIIDVPNIEIVDKSADAAYQYRSTSSSVEDYVEVGRTKMTQAQKREMLGTISLPTTPFMVAGFVCDHNTFTEVLRVLLSKLHKFRDPFYVLQEMDWPLITQVNRVSLTAPLFGSAPGHHEPSEVFFGLDSSPPPPPDASCELSTLLLEAMHIDAADLAVHQRLGSPFRVHPEEISVHVNALLLPPDTTSEEHRIVGYSFCNASLPSAGSTSIVQEVEFAAFVVVLTQTFCLFRDFNFEGSNAATSDDLFKPLLTYGMSELEYVCIGFGYQHLILSFGEGTDEIQLLLRDPASTLRMLALLREVAPSRCAFVQLPLPREAADTFSDALFSEWSVKDYFQVYMAQFTRGTNITTPAPVQTRKKTESVLEPAAAGSGKSDAAQEARRGAGDAADAAAQGPQRWERNVYPLRYFPGLGQSSWERVSILCAAPKQTITIVHEHYAQWGTPSQAMTEVVTFPVSAVSFIEVSPRLSRVPLIAALHVKLGDDHLDKFVFAFQHRSALDKFVLTLSHMYDDVRATKEAPSTKDQLRISAASLLFPKGSMSARENGKQTLLVTQLTIRGKAAFTPEEMMEALI